MTDPYQEQMTALTRAVLESPGTLEPGLRGSACDSARINSDASKPPADWAPLISKIATEAYKITDADIAALHDAGYDDDAIFEMTLAAALGSAQSRLRFGLAALAGDGSGQESPK